MVEYMGEILDAGELKRRTEQYDNEGDQHLYFMQIDAHNTVDASRMSNLARFMNHGCEPNCESQKWTVDGAPRPTCLHAHDRVDALVSELQSRLVPSGPCR